MPDKMPRPEEHAEPERLLTEMHALIPDVVRQACHKLSYHPGAAELNGIKQDLFVTLINKDYHTLRSFRGNAEPRTWLFKIAVRQILERLKKEKKKVSLDDLPPDSLVVQASQEEELSGKEAVALLDEVAADLTPHQRELFGLVRSEATNKEIAQQLGITVASAAVERSRLMGVVARISSEGCGSGAVVSFSCDEKENRLPPPQLA